MNNFIKFHKITNDTELYELLYNKSPEEVEDLRKTNKGMAGVWNDIINNTNDNGDNNNVVDVSEDNTVGDVNDDADVAANDEETDDNMVGMKNC